MLKTSLVIILLSLTLSLIPAISHAHTDHEEIQVKTTFEVNNRQQLSAISMVWLFDTFSSTDKLQHEKDINRLAKTLISDLSRFNFFTRINTENERITANSVNRYKLTQVIDKDNNPALQLSFRLLLKKPIALNTLKKIEINHTDPTGQALLYYDKSDDIALTGQLKSKCKSAVKDKAEFIEGQFPQIALVVCRS